MHTNVKHVAGLAVASAMLVAAVGVAAAPTPASDAGAAWRVADGPRLPAAVAAASAPLSRRTDLRGDALRSFAKPGRKHSAVRRGPQPARFVPFGVPGEGVAATNAAPWHAVGLTGGGVKIAIIDGGFAGLAERQAAGDIPASVTTADFCGGRFGGPGDHGTAVAEIVAELAPAAQLYLVCIDTNLGLAQAVAYAKANGVHVINLSGGFMNTWRGDGSGPSGTPDAIAADARANGILWVNSAGNEAESHWGGTFVSADGDGFNEFGPGDEANSFLVPSGNVVCGFLRWDNWPVASDDYDLGLYDLELGRFVAVSEGDQVGDRLPPTEELCVENQSGGTRHAGFAIFRYAGGAAPTFDLFVLGAPYSLALERPTPSRSLVEPAASPNTMAVGAICWETNGLEPYSSQGPTIDNRLKPDLTAPDSTSGATYGAFAGCGRSGFAGTSASAPHATGAAALVKQRYPRLTAAGIQKYLSEHAGDLGSAGLDNAFGAGKLALPAIPSATVKAAPARGRFGRTVRLRFSVAGVEWETRARVEVFRGSARIRSVDVPFAQADSRIVPWRAPARATRRSAFRFCVQAWDRAEQASKRSCAPVRLV